MSGKLRGQRAKSMKFVDGLMIHSGDPVNDYVDSACRHVLLRQGVLGIKVMHIRNLIPFCSLLISSRHLLKSTVKCNFALPVVSRSRLTSFWVWSMPHMTSTSIRSLQMQVIYPLETESL